MLRGEATDEEFARFKQAAHDVAPSEIYEFSLKEDFLQRLANLNPVATTLFYEQFVENVCAILIGLPPSRRRRLSAPIADRLRHAFGIPFACMVSRT